MSGQGLGFRRVSSGSFDQSQFQLATSLDDGFGASRVTFAGQLYENFVVIADATTLDGRLREAEGVDAALDGFERLGHGRVFNLRDGRGAQSQCVSGGVAGSGREIPNVGVLRADQIAELRELRGFDVAHEDVGIVGAAYLVVVNILGAQLVGQTVDRLVRFLGNGFLHLHLENQVRAALQVEAELNLTAEIVLHLRERFGKIRQTDKVIDTEQND